ncbi:ATP-binding protein [Nonomuraea terrae]|uniref:ATP-binding protein n=1 Tax=Nonomuraea terrae TaxID=2530383 RepID=UPI0037BA3A8A
MSSEMNTHLNLLCLGPQARDDESILDSVRVLHKQGERLNVIVAFGKGALDAVLLECYEHESQPLVLPVPGVDDLHKNVAGRLVERALVKDWRDVEADLWSGEYTEIVETMRDQVFRDFLDWARGYTVEAWQLGMLPGEGSTRITIGDRQIGLIVANTVFRMVASPPDHTLATCTIEQLSHAVGGDYTAWKARNDLTMVIAAEPAALPPGFPLDGSTLLLAGRHGGDDAWSVGDRPYRSIRAQFGRTGRPEVTDTVEGRRMTLLRRAARQEPAPEPVIEERYDEAKHLHEFYRQAESGRMVLVLVSGAVKDIIDLDELREQISVRTYGNLPSSQPPMRSIWPDAVGGLAAPQLQSVLQQLRIAPDAQPLSARNLLRSPWWRIYDFTGSNALQAAAGADDQISARIFNACHERPEEDPTVNVEIIAMNGMVSDDLASVDFGPASTHADPRSQWFRQFQTDALLHPMVWMATSPSSQALWEWMEPIATPAHESLPARFVVTAEGIPADRARLRHNGLIHIRQDPAAFAVTSLRPGIEQLRRGRDRRVALIDETRLGKGVSLVSSLIKDRPAGSKDYLKGHDPTWGDIVDGKAAKLSVVEAIRRAAVPDASKIQPIVLVKGRAGSGKTTALMHFAYHLYRKGKTVGWIDRETTRSRRAVVDEVLKLNPDAMFVDDVAIFSSHAATLLRHLNRNGQTLVVASVRRTREDVLDATFQPRVVAADDPLSDDDLEKLVKILKNNGLLGILKEYRFMGQRVERLRQLSGRSLLAAMIEVVTRQRFEDKVRSEYEQLSDERKLIYATVSFLQSELVNKQHGIDEGDLIQVVSQGAPGIETVNAINVLVGQRLLNRTPEGALRCRQKTFADTVVDSTLKEQPVFLAEIIRSLLVFYAERGGHISRHDHPYRMVMVRLLNHDMMKKTKIPYGDVRSIYDSVHDLLHEDFHYWLQRGQFELERGDLSIAANHLHSATGCDGGATDHLVQTTSSSIRLRHATTYPQDAASFADAKTALDDLERIARRKGPDSPHTFAVMVRDGFNWMKACQSVVSKDEFLDLGNQILDICELGKEVCENNNQFLDVADRYEAKIRRLMSVPM